MSEQALVSFMIGRRFHSAFLSKLDEKAETDKVVLMFRLSRSAVGPRQSDRETRVRSLAGGAEGNGTSRILPLSVGSNSTEAGLAMLMAGR